MASFGIIGHQMCNSGNQNLQSEITGTQTIVFPTHFGVKLSEFHPVFPFSLMSASNAVTLYFHCSYVYKYYSSSRTLCIKC
jgi:hypothetical protein